MTEIIEPQVPEKHTVKEKLQAIIDTYPEILDSSKLELSKDGKHFYILLANARACKVSKRLQEE